MKQVQLTLCCLLFLSVISVAQELPRFRISGTGGYSYFLKTDPPEELAKVLIKNDAYNNYIDKISWGLNAEGNAHYILKSGLGFGAKYRYWSVEAPATDLFFDAGQEHYGVVNLSEDNRIMFIAPSIMYAKWLHPSGRLLGTGAISVGYTYLESSGNVDFQRAMFDGSNLGFQADLGVDYFLTRNISLGLSTGYFYSKIKKVAVNLSENKTELPENAQPDLSNIKLNFLLSINF